MILSVHAPPRSLPPLPIITIQHLPLFPPSLAQACLGPVPLVPASPPGHLCLLATKQKHPNPSSFNLDPTTCLMI